MRKSQIGRTVKVGIFSIIAIVIITALIFTVGSRQRSFGKKKRVYVEFNNVSGLKKGNSIRFAGVVIGAVEKIEITSDTTVMVTLLISEDESKFIKTDSKVNISTEGLLGSKYIRITAGSQDLRSIQDGDHLSGIEPVDMDETMVSIAETGNNFKNISGQVNQIVSKVNNGEGFIGGLIADTIMNHKINVILNSFISTGENTKTITHGFREFVDTVKITGNNLLVVSEELKGMSYKLRPDSSTIGTLINDTLMTPKIYTTISDFQITAENAKVTSAKMKNSWIVKTFGGKSEEKKKKKK